MQVSRPAWYGSTDLLRSLVVRFGVLTSLLLSLALLVLSLLERQRAVIADAEHSRGLVAAALERGLQGLNLVGGDVVEVSPPFDPSGNTALVGGTMMFEILCVLAQCVRKRKG